MRRTSILLLVGAFLCITAPVVQAQDYVNTPVEISKEKVRLNGKVYYSHTVKERQTLYSIAKTYGVTVVDLYDANTSLLQDGLKAGSILLVPAGSAAGAAAQDGFEDRPGYLKHSVKWFEDINDVASRYGVTPEEIMKANGLKSSRISKRQVLYIPEKGTVAEPPAPAPATDVAVATPEIPKLADPEIENTELAQTGTYKPLNVNTPVVETAKPLETAAPATEETVEDPGILPDWLTGKGSVNLALVLPFNGGKGGESHMDFYSGVLMALRDIEADGMKATLNVYDLSVGVPSAVDLSGNDFILGPIATKDLTTMLERAGGRIPVISPLDQRAAQLADTEQLFIQGPAAPLSQYKDLADWAAAETAPSDRLIFITEKVSPSTAPAVGVRNALLANGASYEGHSWTQAESRALTSLSSLVVKGGVNRILLASENETFVADVVRNIGILQGRGYEFVLYAPSRVRTFDSVEGTGYHQCNLHISSAYYADYENPSVRSFVRKYRALFQTEPSQFAFQGYDLTRYFAHLVTRYGNRWIHALDSVPGTGLHTDFRFEPTQGRSYRNTGVRRIIYRSDYSTELVR